MLPLVSPFERGSAIAAASVMRPVAGGAPDAGFVLGRAVIRHERWPRAGDRTRHRPETWPRAGDRTRHCPETWWMLLVLALMACNVFLGLGTSVVNDFDEARYGVSAFEMQQHRSFVVTTYAGKKELWALKPPLGYWLMALSLSLFGGSALALRLPSALCSLAAVAVTMMWARRWFDARLAIVAGAVLATTFGFLSHHGARSGDFDACLTLIVLLVAVRLPGLGESQWRVLSLALLLACGFLLKSFAIVPILLVAGSYVLWTGAWRRQRLIPCLAALGLFAVIVGAWAFARWRADGSPDFLIRMLREDVVGRSTSIVDRSSSSPFGYVTALFDRFAPWPPLMIAAAVVALRAGLPRRLHAGPPAVGRAEGRADLDARIPALLCLWAAVPLTFVSLVRTQHHWYLDPIYPALAMLAAAGVLYLVERTQPGRRRTLALIGLVALPLALCEGRVLARALIEDPMPADQRFLSALKSTSRTVCREILSTCQLEHSERFLLEVVDGFEVVEPGGARPATARFPDDTCLLVGKSAWRRPPAPPADRLPARDRLLMASPSYALYRGAGAGALPLP
jgi:4-amino-4-deoxy-L-arabinose transferase-like glycosyltransferase